MEESTPNVLRLFNFHNFILSLCVDRCTVVEKPPRSIDRERSTSSSTDRQVTRDWKKKEL